MRFPWQPPQEDAEQRLARIYGEAAGAEWQQVRRVLSLQQDFRLIVLLVPDNDAASLCKLAAMALSGPRYLLDWQLLGPEQLYELPARLARVRISDPAQVLWVQAVLPHSHADQPAWERAWAEAAARLNERRDVLRAQIRGTLVLCGAAWIVPVLRDAAPDLWSVRTLVARIQQRPPATKGPEKEPGGQPIDPLRSLTSALNPAQDSIWRFARVAGAGRLIALGSDLRTPAVISEVAAELDPQLALNRALPLRTATDASSRTVLAVLLLRAAYGFALRRNARETERLAGEVWVLSQEPVFSPKHKDALQSQGLALRAWARLLARHTADAIACAERALSLAQSMSAEPALAPSATARSPVEPNAADPNAGLDVQSGRRLALRLASNVLWLARFVLGDEIATEAAYQAWQIHEGRDPRREDAEAERLLALADHLDGKHAEAAAHLQLALSQQEAATAPPIERAHTLGMLASCFLELEKHDSAERYAKRALLLYEAEPDGPEIPLARGFVHFILSRTLFQTQRFAECIEETQQAIALLTASGASFDVLYRARLQAAFVPTMLGQTDKTADAVLRLLDDVAQQPTTADNLEQQVFLAELAHSSLLWNGQNPRGLAVLREVDHRLVQAQADPKLHTRVARRLQLMHRFRWIVPGLSLIARLRLWLYRHGLDPISRDPQRPR